MLNIFLIVALIVSIWAFTKEPEITGLYKAAGIYGRIYAYVAMSFMLAAVMSILALFTGELFTVGNDKIVLSILSIFIGGFMYYRVYAKSPDFLKKRCLLDLTISGFGVAVRVSLFFMSFFVKAWWEATKPSSYALNDGTEVYVFPDGRVYNPLTGKYGKASSNRDVVLWDE